MTDMGYCMEQREGKFTIKAGNVAGALAAIKALDPDAPGAHPGGSRSSGGKVSRHFSWVDTEDFRNAETLSEALKAWRWGVTHGVDSKGRNKPGVAGLYFEGDKRGDDKTLFDAIAPYVEPESFLEMSGEDNVIWRWVFDGKECVEVQAEVDWGRNREIVEALLEHKGILPTLIGIHPALDVAIAKEAQA